MDITFSFPCIAGILGHSDHKQERNQQLDFLKLTFFTVSYCFTTATLADFRDKISGSTPVLVSLECCNFGYPGGSPIFF